MDDIESIDLKNKEYSYLLYINRIRPYYELPVSILDKFQKDIEKKILLNHPLELNEVLFSYYIEAEGRLNSFKKAFKLNFPSNLKVSNMAKREPASELNKNFIPIMLSKEKELESFLYQKCLLPQFTYIRENCLKFLSETKEKETYGAL